jgi:hypothetical protein
MCVVPCVLCCAVLCRAAALRGRLPNSLGQLQQLWVLSTLRTSMICNATTDPPSPPDCPLPDWLVRMPYYYYERNGRLCQGVTFKTVRPQAGQLSQLYAGAPEPEVGRGWGVFMGVVPSLCPSARAGPCISWCLPSCSMSSQPAVCIKHSPTAQPLAVLRPVPSRACDRHTRLPPLNPTPRCTPEYLQVINLTHAGLVACCCGCVLCR